jgi:hypothetical protein
VSVLLVVCDSNVVCPVLTVDCRVSLSVADIGSLLSGVGPCMVVG